MENTINELQDLGLLANSLLEIKVKYTVRIYIRTAPNSLTSMQIGT